MKCIDSNKTQTNISLYTWQQDIYSFAYYISAKL